jgi:hypothetical protein
MKLIFVERDIATLSFFGLAETILGGSSSGGPPDGLIWFAQNSVTQLQAISVYAQQRRMIPGTSNRDIYFIMARHVRQQLD